LGQSNQSSVAVSAWKT